MRWQVEKVVFYNFLYFFGTQVFHDTNSTNARFKVRIYLDTFFVLNWNVIYHIE